MTAASRCLRAPRWRVAFRLLLALVAAVSTIGALPSTSYAEAIPKYELGVTLDYAASTATVSETVLYPNRTGATLKTVAFSAMPLHLGALSLKSTSVDGAPATPRIDNITIEVPLGKSLQPGESVTIAFEFTLTIPREAGGRFSRGSGITSLGNFFPIAQVFRGGDWPRYRYTEVGDAFFSEASDFEVTLTLRNAPPTTIVAHSGELVARDGQKWLLRGRSIRDFAMCISDRYEATSEQVGSTSLSVFYLPEHEAGGRQMLQTGVELLKWANERLGPYPYPSLHIAESPGMEGVGQEYPNLVFIGTGVVAGPTGRGSYSAYIVAHELIHQWFYGLVGNDQLMEPWLDEGPTVHLAYQYVKSAAPSSYEAMWNNLVSSHRAAVSTFGVDPPLDASVYDYKDDNQYFALMYRKAALFLEELRQRMGDTAYYALMRDFSAQHRYGIVTTADFLKFAAGRYGDGFAAVAVRYFSLEAMRALQPATPTPQPTATMTPAPTPTATRTPSPAPSATAAPTQTPAPSEAPSSPATAETPSPTEPETIRPLSAGEAVVFAAEMPTPPAAAAVVVAATVERQYPVDAPVAGAIGLGVGLGVGWLVWGRRPRRRRW